MAKDDAVLRATERFAGALELAGIARMPARVFAYVIADDRHSYTARDLAEGLGVSAAAISGAVRPLVEMRLLLRSHSPGSRADLFQISEGDVWGAISRQRLPVLDHMVDAAREAAAIVGDDSPGAQRLRETVAFFEFNREYLVGMLEEWAVRRERR